MNVQQFTQILEANGDSLLRFKLPTGDYVPQHFHVTEVGRIDKNFIDCGGTRRQAAACSLQLWFANDFDHRLSAGKLAKIIKLAAPILNDDALPIDVEYGTEVAAQYGIRDAVKLDDHLLVEMVGKQTDCLAKDQCGGNECYSPGCCA